MGKTVKVTFDCGDAGKVTWELPQGMFKAGLSDREKAKIIQTGWGDSVKTFFLLMYVLGGVGGETLDLGMRQIDSALKGIAETASRRLQR